MQVDRADMNEMAGGMPWPLITMAAQNDPPQAHHEHRDGDVVLSGRKILIVEDESLIALLIADACEEAGAEIVGPCYTLAECMKVVRADAVDAAVLDLDLAGEDVFPAAEELRSRHIPFVFHTAHGDREELQARFGDVAVCRKPINMDDLVAVLAHVAMSAERH